ncbi:hypothetical protein ALC53_14085 [Atta colombica]|uniref:Uncharacterized protein n=1 Tax=Atta colombica TaxID=520822 RepID=A0A195ATS8_9HYME|nr:hypothetical protein ALC53_14085 [Atta colombica]
MIVNEDKENIENSEYLSSRNERGSSDDEPFPKKQKVNVTTRSSTCRIHKLANDIKKHSFPCISINTIITETQLMHKRHTKMQLPSLEDIKTLYNEIERIFIKDFRNYYSNIYTSLSTQNRKIAERYIRFYVRGKLERRMPILLSHNLFECINLILKFREEAKISKKNSYVFGLPDIEKCRYKYLRTCALMRKFAIKCNAVHSNTLRSTTLKKNMSTYCIQLNVSEIDASDLNIVMGHVDKMDTKHKQSLSIRDVLKISQYLEAIQGHDENYKRFVSSSSESEENELEIGNINEYKMKKEDLSMQKLQFNPKM